MSSYLLYPAILVKIHIQIYSISINELNQLFSRFEILEDVEILGEKTGFHSRICFKNWTSAIDAFNFLNGRNVYDGCCRMELFLDQISRKANRVESLPPLAPKNDETGGEVVNEDSGVVHEIANGVQSLEHLEQESNEQDINSDLYTSQSTVDQPLQGPLPPIRVVQPPPQMPPLDHQPLAVPALADQQPGFVQAARAASLEGDRPRIRLDISNGNTTTYSSPNLTSLEVITAPFASEVSNVALSEKTGKLMGVPCDLIGIEMNSFRKFTKSLLGTYSAYQVFDEMLDTEFNWTIQVNMLQIPAGSWNGFGKLSNWSGFEFGEPLIDGNNHRIDCFKEILGLYKVASDFLWHDLKDMATTKVLFGQPATNACQESNAQGKGKYEWCLVNKKIGSILLQKVTGGMTVVCYDPGGDLLSLTP